MAKVGTSNQDCTISFKVAVRNCVNKKKMKIKVVEVCKFMKCVFCLVFPLVACVND